MPKEIYILVGLPGSGKSTWVKNFVKDKDIVIISSDNLIEEWGLQYGYTYDTAYRKVSFKEIEKKMNSIFENAKKDGKTIVVDRTNMTVKSRKKWLSGLTDYTRNAVVFIIPDNELQKRLTYRAKTEGKTIPGNVISSMAASYIRPTKEEGFDNIIDIKK